MPLRPGSVTLSLLQMATQCAEGGMSKWEYKCVPLDRKGTKEDFSFSWKYGPWELAVNQAGKKLLPAGLDELGQQGWELAGVLPNDLWSEGTRTGNSSHGVRTISCILLFKRPAQEAAKTSAVRVPTTSSAPKSPAATPASGAPPESTPPSSAPPGGTPTEETSAGDTPAGDSPAGDTPPENAPPAASPPATTPSDNPA